MGLLSIDQEIRTNASSAVLCVSLEFQVLGLVCCVRASAKRRWLVVGAPGRIGVAFCFCFSDMRERASAFLQGLWSLEHLLVVDANALNNACLLSKGLLTLYDLFVSNSADDARRKSAKTINFRPPLALPPLPLTQIDPQNVFLPRVASQPAAARHRALHFIS